MTKFKKILIIIIIAGLFIPAVLSPFTSLNPSATLLRVSLGSRGVVFEPRLNDLEVVLKKGIWKEGMMITNTYYEGHYEGRITIPYNYPFAIGFTIAFLGISLIVLTGIKSKKD